MTPRTAVPAVRAARQLPMLVLIRFGGHLMKEVRVIHGSRKKAEEAVQSAAQFREAISFPGVRRYVTTVLEFYDGYRAEGAW